MKSILDCPIKKLPSKGGNYRNLKRVVTKYTYLDKILIIREVLKILAKSDVNAIRILNLFCVVCC